MSHLRPTFSRTRPYPGSPLEVLRGLTFAERDREFRGRYALCLILSGEAEIVSNGKRFLVEAGQGAMLGPHGRHVSRTLTETCDFVLVLVDSHAVEGARRRLDLPRDAFFETRQLRDKLAIAAVFALAECIEDISELGLMLDRLDESLAAIIGVEMASIGRHEAGDIVDSADAHLRAMTGERLPLDDLESLSGGDRLTLVRAFQQHLGEGPTRHHLSLRLEMARRLIHEGLHVVEAAYQTGFSAQGEFSRLFRRKFGFTPDRWALHSDAAPSRPVPIHRRAAVG